MSNKQIYSIIAVLLVWFWAMVIMAVLLFATPTSKRIDCSMAEFHPDFTPAMRQTCRKVKA